MHTSFVLCPGKPFNSRVSDEIYLESWAATIQVCKEQLDDIDYKHALQVKNIDMFRQELDQLRSRYSGDAQRHVIALLYPALDNYDRFATTFVKMMEHTADVSMLWGLLYLVIKASTHHIAAFAVSTNVA